MAVGYRGDYHHLGCGKRVILFRLMGRICQRAAIAFVPIQNRAIEGLGLSQTPPCALLISDMQFMTKITTLASQHPLNVFQTTSRESPSLCAL